MTVISDMLILQARRSFLDSGEPQRTRIFGKLQMDSHSRERRVSLPRRTISLSS